jgi:hypothetical protein
LAWPSGDLRCHAGDAQRFFYLFMVMHTYKLKCQTLPRFNSGIVKIVAPPFVVKFVIVGDELSC